MNKIKHSDDSNFEDASTMNLNDFGFEYLGKLATKKSTDIESSRLGVGFETLDRDMWKVEHAWPVLNDLGIKWARTQTGWAKTETREGVYDFRWLDEIVDKQLERGVQPWLSVSYGNKLYTPDASADGVGYPPVYTQRERDGWTRYVKALAKHYRERVTHYEVWNEPNVGFFKPKPDPALYVELVRLTVEAIKAEHPEAKIVGGAIGNMHPKGLNFTYQCFENGMAEYIDAISYHGYKFMPEQYVEQEFPAYLRMLRTYKPGLPYWQGEVGCPSYIPEGNTQALAGMTVSESIQARWLVRRILVELGYDAAHVSYFNMGDFTHYKFDGDLGYASYYGVIRMEDGTPKPAYYALQSLATLLHDPLEVSDGRTNFRLESAENDCAVSREQAAAAWQTSLVRGDVPVYAWWLREGVEKDPAWQTIRLAFWLDNSLKLPDPVLIDPLTQEVYQLEVVPNYYVLQEFVNLPISNSPLILTDRSIVDIC